MVRMLRRGWFRIAARARCVVRASERGAAIFIVLLVLAVLTAIGVFATRVAGLNVRSSGYDRHATQTGYVADYGTLAALEQVGPAAGSYVQVMTANPDQCSVNAYSISDGGMESGLPCKVITQKEIQDNLDQSGSNVALFDTDGGSLGPSPDPNETHPKIPWFQVELHDPGPSGRPVAGFDQGGTGQGFGWLQFTVTGIAQVRPYTPGGGNCASSDELLATQTAGTRTTRAVTQFLVPKQ